MTDVKDSMPVLERFVVVMSYHTNRSMMPEMFWLFAHKGRNKEEKNMRGQVKVKKNNRQTNKYGDSEHLLRLTE